MSSDKNDNTNEKNTTRKEPAKVANLKVAEVSEQRDIGKKNCTYRSRYSLNV